MEMNGKQDREAETEMPGPRERRSGRAQEERQRQAATCTLTQTRGKRPDTGRRAASEQALRQAVSYPLLPVAPACETTRAAAGSPFLPEGGHRRPGFITLQKTQAERIVGKGRKESHAHQQGSFGARGPHPGPQPGQFLKSPLAQGGSARLPWWHLTP